ncbi:MAG: hypothetical protein VKI81_03860 [Synechococcaceae cyanobacterium]|nr:hypothetical protein [Synechococcaceae cyanobacterium]
MGPTCGPNGRCPMGLTHCPLCVGLAVLSALRGLGHLVLLWRLRPLPRPRLELQPL